MIYAAIGENTFARDEALGTIAGDGAVQKYDGAALTTNDLPEILGGQTLFGNDTVNVIEQLSANKSLWEALPEWLGRADNVVFVEATPDKRTRAYKALQKEAEVITCDFWTDRQIPHAVKWLRDYANKQGITLKDDIAKEMVRRAVRASSNQKNTIIDQQLLASAIAQLRHADTIDLQALDTVLAPSAHENIFELFTSALDGDVPALQQKIHNFKIHQDGHLALGLLGSQLSNLVALVIAPDKSIQEIAKDIGAHPFALEQLGRYRQRLTRHNVAQMVEILADADIRLKRSQAEPWVLIEKALVEIALTQK